MKPIWRKILNALFIFGVLTLVILMAFGNNELANAWETLFDLDPMWLAAALVCWLTCLLFDAASCYNFLRQQHYPVSYRRAFFISSLGYFYSNITPGASGGQPMQVYYMNKAGVPVGVATSCVTIKLVCSQFMIVLISSLLWAFNADFVNAQLSSVKWIIIIGWIINFMAIPPIILLSINRALVQRILLWFVRLGGRIKLIKDVDTAALRVETTLDAYRDSMLRLGRHPGQIAVQLLTMGISITALMCVVLCVFRAFGGTMSTSAAAEGTPWYHLLTVAFLLFVSTSYTPLPGASGAQEGGFLVFYRGLFPAGTAGLTLLIYRFFSYYMFLIEGAVFVVTENIRSNRRKAKRQAAESKNQ